MNEKLIYGKNDLTNIVSIEVENDHLVLFREFPDKPVQEIKVKYPGQFLLFNRPLSGKMEQLEGDLFYRYIINYGNLDKLNEVKQKCYRKQRKFYTIAEPKENAMVQTGHTYYKDMNPQDVSILSFDLENTTLTHNEDSKILIISNTFRKGNEIIHKMFCYDEYENEGDMISAWCAWVREMDPSIICGHNIYGYDFPYLRYCAEREGVQLDLGRNGSEIRFNKKVSKKRKDGSQEYEFLNAWIYGREIIDTFFLAITYDVGRRYPSYGLKAIIEFENLEVKGRQHYDASQIHQNYKIPDEWVKIKKYAEHDADDSLSLIDLMIPSFFHYTKSIPKPFQQIINSASGSQVNSVMVRAYLQDGHSLPKADENGSYEGAISFGNPGIYKKVYKVDVASLYPSIMRHYKVHDADKDPKKYFLDLVEIFTIERLKNKQQHKETGDRTFKDLSDAQKIMINSAYGFLGSTGLLFNSPENAAFVTRKGREILQTGLDWCQEKGYTVVNADTDSFSYAAPKGYKLQTYLDDIDDLNSLFPELIVWEDDGPDKAKAKKKNFEERYYPKAIIVKTKNYVLDHGKEVTIKGSALKATMKEPKLKQMIKDIIHYLLKDQPFIIPLLYQKYMAEVDEIKTVQDMAGWASKKTITEAVLKSNDTTPRKIRNALKTKHVQEGDKIFVFFKEDESLSLLEHFDGDFSKEKLYGKIYKTWEVFENLFNPKLLMDFSKSTHRKAVNEFIDAA